MLKTKSSEFPVGLDAIEMTPLSCTLHLESTGTVLPTAMSKTILGLRRMKTAFDVFLYCIESIIEGVSKADISFSVFRGSFGPDRC